MAFTSAEVNKCAILLADKVVLNSTFVKWSFIIIDSYGKTYEWAETSENLNYASAPTSSQVTDYVSDYLQGNAHASGGGTYSSVAPTQETTHIKVNITYDNGSNLATERPGKDPAPPGNPN